LETNLSKKLQLLQKIFPKQKTEKEISTKINKEFQEWKHLGTVLKKTVPAQKLINQFNLSVISRKPTLIFKNINPKINS